MLGAGGCPTNTSYKGRVIRLLEIKLNFPLQWSICVLHTCELPFRHIFLFFDGKSMGPSAFQGPIGKMITSRKEPFEKIVKFKRISGKVPQLSDDFVKNLSCDAKYLYDICLAVQGTTEFSDSLV